QRITKRINWKTVSTRSYTVFYLFGILGRDFVEKLDRENRNNQSDAHTSVRVVGDSPNDIALDKIEREAFAYIIITLANFKLAKNPKCDMRGFLGAACGDLLLNLVQRSKPKLQS